jgi:hypothetical protein
MHPPRCDEIRSARHSEERRKGELEQISWRMRQPAETGSAYPRSPAVRAEDSRGAECRADLILLNLAMSAYSPASARNAAASQQLLASAGTD